jgi:hypothetical protein
MNTNSPLIALLTPAARPILAEGMMAADGPITQGLPHLVPLGPRLRAILVLPTGLARQWRDLAPATLVASAGAEQAPPAGDGPDLLARPVPRLRIQRDGVTITVLPLTAGTIGHAVDATGAVRLEVQVLDWAIHAGTVVGPGDHGSFLRLGWRVADRAADRFAPLPPSEAVWRLLPPAEKMESPPYDWRRRVRIDVRLNRLSALRARIR